MVCMEFGVLLDLLIATYLPTYVGGWVGRQEYI